MATREDEILRRLAQGHLSPFDVAAHPELGMLRDTPPEPRATIGPQQGTGIRGLLNYQGPLHAGRIARERAQEPYNEERGLAQKAGAIREAAARDPAFGYAMLGARPQERPVSWVDFTDAGDVLAAMDAGDHLRFGEYGPALFDASTAAIGTLLPFGSIRGLMGKTGLHRWDRGSGTIELPGIGGAWRSRTLEAIQNAPQERMTRQQWEAHLKKNPNPETGQNQGTHPAELEITNVGPFLRQFEADDVITREQIREIYEQPDLDEVTFLPEDAVNALRSYEYNIERAQNLGLPSGNYYYNLADQLEDMQLHLGEYPRYVEKMVEDAPDSRVAEIIEGTEWSDQDDLSEAMAKLDAYRTELDARAAEADRQGELFADTEGIPEDINLEYERASNVMTEMRMRSEAIDEMAEAEGWLERYRQSLEGAGGGLDDWVRPEADEFDSYVWSGSSATRNRYGGRHAQPMNQRTHVLRYGGPNASGADGHYGVDDQLVHVRLSERVAPNGDTVLFVDEVQSDPFQNLAQEAQLEPVAIREVLEEAGYSPETIRTMENGLSEKAFRRQAARMAPEQYAARVEQRLGSQLPSAEADAARRAAQEEYARRRTRWQALHLNIADADPEPFVDVVQRTPPPGLPQEAMSPLKQFRPLDTPLPGAWGNEMPGEAMKDDHAAMLATAFIEATTRANATPGQIAHKTRYFIQNEPDVFLRNYEEYMRLADERMASGAYPSVVRSDVPPEDVFRGFEVMREAALENSAMRSDFNEAYERARELQPFQPHQANPWERTNDWQALGVRRAVQDALANDLDRVVMTTGRQSIGAVGTNSPSGMFYVYDQVAMKKALDQVRKDLGLPKSALSRFKMDPEPPLYTVQKALQDIATESESLSYWDSKAVELMRNILSPTGTKMPDVRNVNWEDPEAILDYWFKNEENYANLLRSQTLGSTGLREYATNLRRSLNRVEERVREAMRLQAEVNEKGQWSLDLSDLDRKDWLRRGIPILGVGGVGVLGRQSFEEAVRERERQSGG